MSWCIVCHPGGPLETEPAVSGGVGPNGKTGSLPWCAAPCYGPAQSCRRPAGGGWWAPGWGGEPLASRHGVPQGDPVLAQRVAAGRRWGCTSCRLQGSEPTLGAPMRRRQGRCPCCETPPVTAPRRGTAGCRPPQPAWPPPSRQSRVPVRPAGLCCPGCACVRVPIPEHLGLQERAVLGPQGGPSERALGRFQV